TSRFLIIDQATTPKWRDLSEGEWSSMLRQMSLPLIHADTRLNDLLLKYCETALAERKGDISQLRTRVENAISTMLPHGRVLVEDVARSLGMSERTLARRLSDEGLNFTEILQQLRRDLAVRYLDDRKLHVSKIAWMLGFTEVSAFTHACRRWTGKTPREMRTRLLSSTLPQRLRPGDRPLPARAPARKERCFFDGSFRLNHKALQSIAREFER